MGRRRAVQGQGGEEPGHGFRRCRFREAPPCRRRSLQVNVLVGLWALFGETMVGNAPGVWKTRTVQRKPAEHKRQAGGLSKACWVPRARSADDDQTVRSSWLLKRPQHSAQKAPQAPASKGRTFMGPSSGQGQTVGDQEGSQLPEEARRCLDEVSKLCGCVSSYPFGRGVHRSFRPRIGRVHQGADMELRVRFASWRVSGLSRIFSCGPRHRLWSRDGVCMYSHPIAWCAARSVVQRLARWQMHPHCRGLKPHWVPMRSL